MHVPIRAIRAFDTQSCVIQALSIELSNLYRHSYCQYMKLGRIEIKLNCLEANRLYTKIACV